MFTLRSPPSALCPSERLRLLRRPAAASASTTTTAATPAPTTGPRSVTGATSLPRHVDVEVRRATPMQTATPDEPRYHQQQDDHHHRPDRARATARFTRRRLLNVDVSHCPVPRVRVRIETAP